MVVLSGQVQLHERLQKLNTPKNRQNSGNEVTGEIGYFFGMSSVKGHGIGRGLLRVNTNQCWAHLLKRPEVQPREPQAVQGHFDEECAIE